MLVAKGLAVEGHGGFPQRGPALRLQVLKLLAAPQVERQVHLVGRHLQSARIGQHNLRAVEALVRLVDNELVEHTRLHVLLLHVDVHVGHTVVEHALGNLHRRRSLFHANQQRAHTDGGLGRGLVLNIKRKARDKHRREHDGAHHTEQRNTSRLHRKQLQVLAHISKRNQRGQQHRQWQRSGDERQAHVPEKLCQNGQRQSLAHQFVNIAPRKLHHKDEQTDKERCHKEQQELSENVSVKFFDNIHGQWPKPLGFSGQRYEKIATTSRDNHRNTFSSADGWTAGPYVCLARRKSKLFSFPF